MESTHLISSYPRSEHTFLNAVLKPTQAIFYLQMNTKIVPTHEALFGRGGFQAPKGKGIGEDLVNPLVSPNPLKSPSQPQIPLTIQTFGTRGFEKSNLYNKNGQE